MNIIENAPAKINLGLRVLGRRPDGFHDILSIFQTVSLYDSLILEHSDKTSLTCNDHSIPSGNDNLVVKAEQVFKKHTGIAENTKFTLKKKIPAGAGLAGGSSDAAAALRGLCNLNRINVEDNDLRNWGAELGSDIPFQIKGGTAVVSGRGEVIQPVEWQFNFTYVLVFPGFGVSTAEAYRSFTEYPDDGGVYKTAVEHLKRNTLKEVIFLHSLINDFERVVFHKYPVLGEIKKEFLSKGADASFLTGSGSTIVGVFEDQNRAKESAGVFKQEYKVFTVSGI